MPPPPSSSLCSNLTTYSFFWGCFTSSMQLFLTLFFLKNVGCDLSWLFYYVILLGSWIFYSPQPPRVYSEVTFLVKSLSSSPTLLLFHLYNSWQLHWGRVGHLRTGVLADFVTVATPVVRLCAVKHIIFLANISWMNEMSGKLCLFACLLLPVTLTSRMF